MLNKIKEGNVKKPRFGTVPSSIAKNAMISKGIWIPFILIIVTYVIFFFVLRDKLLFTPDYGSTDAFHFNLSLKYHLFESLKNYKIPFWTDKLQLGIPLFSEGQIGALFLPNLIFFKLLPFVHAYNFLLVFSLFTLTVGFYLLLVEYKVNRWFALVMSLIFAMNGSISFRWIHLNLIQSFSLTPFLFLFLLRYFKSRNLFYGLLISLSISQMIYAGYYQIVFNSLLALSIWYFVFLKSKEVTHLMKSFFKGIFFIGTGFALALPQLIPTYKLLSFTNRNLSSAYNFAVSFPLTFKHLISFFVPFPFGNPKNATYPQSASTSWGLFWENTPYLGPLYIILILICVLVYFSKNLRFFTKRFNYYLILIIIFLFLSLGKDSPIYFIFDMFPFNMFRVPSKYLVMTNFFLILFTSLILNEIFKFKNKILPILILLISITNLIILIMVIFSYHLFIDAKTLLQPSVFSSYISKKEVVMNFKTEDDWLNQYMEKGWNTKKDINKYLFFNNSIQPNSNLIFAVKNFDINTGGLKLSRAQYIKGILISEIQPINSITYSVTSLFKRIAGIYDVSKIISTVKINNLPLVKKIQDNENSIYLYSVDQKTNPDFYIPSKIININTISDLNKHVMTDMSENTVITEKFKSFTQETQNQKTNMVNSSENLLTLKTHFQKDTFMVFKRTYYPEWFVEIDGKKITYFQTNLQHIGVMVPKGSHVVKVYHRPVFFIIGLGISLVCLTGFIVIIVKNRVRKF